MWPNHHWLLPTMLAATLQKRKKATCKTSGRKLTIVRVYTVDCGALASAVYALESVDCMKLVICCNVTHPNKHHLNQSTLPFVMLHTPTLCCALQQSTTSAKPSTLLCDKPPLQIYKPHTLHQTLNTTYHHGRMLQRPRQLRRGHPPATVSAVSSTNLSRQNWYVPTTFCYTSYITHQTT